ncbi:MAG: hypothetical protein H0U76_18590 [Ktedonobacteraceae bacterium]|nr:hypothetical protein [Ktedonobacteraceae bacterium]
MKQRSRVITLLLVALLGLLLCACGSPGVSRGTTAPTPTPQQGWSLLWAPSDYKEAFPENAFSAQARLIDPSGQRRPTAALVWLVTGKEFALVLVQCDQDAHVFALAAMELQHKGWVLTQSMTVERPLPGKGALQQKWLPPGRYQSASTNLGTLPPSEGNVQLWLSEDGTVIVVAHLRSSIDLRRPTGATTVNIDNHTGWSAHYRDNSALFTFIAVHDEEETVFYAGTTDFDQSQRQVHALLKESTHRSTSR